MGKSDWKKMGIIVIVLLLALSCFGCSKKETEQPANVQMDPPLAEMAQFDGLQQKPTRMKIDKIGVDEAVKAEGLDENEHMKTPVGAKGITWFEYAGYASPGWAGNAVLTGHNYVNNEPGTLVKLNELVVGDIVEFTYADGSIGRFAVKSVDIYDEKEADTAMDTTGATRTTIMTCAGERKPGGGYPQRCVVICEATEHISASGEKLTVKVPESDSLR